MIAIPEIPALPPHVLDSLSDSSKQCIERLAAHNAERLIDLSTCPINKTAAVLVLLYERAGKLRVLLTTRSKSLRSHPGQTAFPGGKVENTDPNIAVTAYREANEEVSLPLHSPHIHTITTLRPFLSPGLIFVVPIVSFCADPSIIDHLKPHEDEVAAIFDHPVQAFLDPAIALEEELVPKGSEHWPYDSELHHPTDLELTFLDGEPYRMHRFRGVASPIKGLTAGIMIHTAEIAYATQASFEVNVQDQRSNKDSFSKVLADHLNAAPNATKT